MSGLSGFEQRQQANHREHMRELKEAEHAFAASAGGASSFGGSALPSRQDPRRSVPPAHKQALYGQTQGSLAARTSSMRRASYAGDENADNDTPWPLDRDCRSLRISSGPSGYQGSQAATRGSSRAGSRARGALTEISNVMGGWVQGDKKTAPVVERSCGALKTSIGPAPRFPPVALAAQAAGAQSVESEGCQIHQQQHQQQQQQQQHLLLPEADVAKFRSQGTLEYTSDIYDRLFRQEAASLPHPPYTETASLPHPTYMDNQKEINSKMRAILVDWLVQVHMKYKLRPETLYLAINIVDRYLARVSVPRKCLQLIGVVAMLIAAKVEEIHPPEVTDFVYITDNAYAKADLLKMEVKMLSTLDFEVAVTTPMHFFDLLMSANESSSVQKDLCRYLLELAIVDPSMIVVRYLPSQLVAAATLLSNEIVRRQLVWPAPMVQVARWSEAHIRACVEELNVLVASAPTNSLQAVRRRYMLEQNNAVAEMNFPRVS